MKLDDIEQYIQNRYSILKSTLYANGLRVIDIMNKLVKVGYINDQTDKEGEYQVTAKLVLREYPPKEVFKQFLPDSRKKIVIRDNKTTEETMDEEDVNKFCQRMQLMLKKYCTHYPSLGTKMDVIRCKKIVSDKINVQNAFKICEILVIKDQTTVDEEILTSFKIENILNNSPIVSMLNENDGLLNLITKVLADEGFLENDSKGLRLKYLPSLEVFQRLLRGLQLDNEPQVPERKLRNEDVINLSKNLHEAFAKFLTHFNSNIATKLKKELTKRKGKLALVPVKQIRQAAKQG